MVTRLQQPLAAHVASLVREGLMVVVVTGDVGAGAGQLYGVRVARVRLRPPLLLSEEAAHCVCRRDTVGVGVRIAACGRTLGARGRPPVERLGRTVPAVQRESRVAFEEQRRGAPREVAACLLHDGSDLGRLATLLRVRTERAQPSVVQPPSTAAACIALHATATAHGEHEHGEPTIAARSPQGQGE